MANSLKPALFKFLKDLAANNSRDWFHANKDRYENEVRGPAVEFISAIEPRIARITPHIVCDPRPNGGSLFRIHKDTRFSKDKTPYKTATGIQLRHEAGKDAHAPGFYLHLEPGRIFAAAGLWRPEPKIALMIREAIAADGAGWKKAVHGAAFQRTFQLEGESLKRPPRGFDPEHEFVDDLKRKDFIAVHHLKQKDVVAKDFDTKFPALCKQGAPLMRFLCGAVGHEF